MNTAKNAFIYPRTESTQWHHRSSDPLDPPRHPVPVRYLVLYLIHLLGYELLALLCLLHALGQISLLAEQSQPVREFLIQRRVQTAEPRPPVSPSSMALEVAPRGLQILGQGAHLPSRKKFFNTPIPLGGAGLS